MKFDWVCRLDISTANFWILIIVLWLGKRISLKEHAEIFRVKEPSCKQFTPKWLEK